MKKILIYILIIATMIPLKSMAVDTYTLLEPLPCIPGTGNSCANTSTSTGTIKEINVETYIGYIFKFAIAISAFLAVVMIIWGGFEIMLSEAIPVKMEGKKRIYDALTGLLMVLASYLILQTIDPRLVEINIGLPGLKPGTGAWQAQMGLTDTVSNVQGNAQVMNTELSKQATGLQMEQSRLDDEYESGIISKAEYDAENELLAARIMANESAIVKSQAMTDNSGAFLSVINAQNDYETTGIYNDTTYDEALKNIRDNTAAKVAELKSLNDLEGAQQLESQEKFFTDQISEQRRVEDLIAIKSQDSLQGQLSAYENQLSIMKSTAEGGNVVSGDVAKIQDIKSDPELAPIYTSILEARIERINAALGNKTENKK